MGVPEESGGGTSCRPCPPRPNDPPFAGPPPSASEAVVLDGAAVLIKEEAIESVMSASVEDLLATPSLEDSVTCAAALFLEDVAAVVENPVDDGDEEGFEDVKVVDSCKLVCSILRIGGAFVAPISSFASTASFWLSSDCEEVCPVVRSQLRKVEK